MAITARYNPATRLLNVFGDDLNNSVKIGRDAAGNLLINGGAVTILGGTATVADVGLIQVLGQGGDDVITLDESLGALPSVVGFGGAGNDTITGGSGSDTLYGQGGADTLNGGGGDDFLFGGAGNDVLSGGAGDDSVFGEDGNDRMVWNSGDGSDLMEGGAGVDVAMVSGGGGAGSFTVTANGARVRLDGVDGRGFNLDIGTTEYLNLNGGGGDDDITAGNGLASLIRLTLNGGAGDDKVTGGDGDDLLFGGPGNDIVAGGRGADTAWLGTGNDTYVWNPGDGGDTVEGDAGVDTLQFNGANVAEKFDVSANGGRVRFTRDVGNVVMDLNAVEILDIVARGGADNVVAHDLTGTGVTQLNIDLAGAPGSGVGDGAADVVTLEDGAAGDRIAVKTSGAAIVVSGMAQQTTITGAEGTNDSLVVEGFGGADVIDASALAAGSIRLTLDGGAGADTIFGSRGADLLLGGDNDDWIAGGQGDDVALLGAGDDRYVWNPGDGSDVVEGQAGVDTLVFNGSGVSETVAISANGGRALLTRDVGNVTMDLNSVERIRLDAGGGADSVFVNDMSGTGVTQVTVDLANIGATAGDAAADQATVNATTGDDVVKIGSSATGDIGVLGLATATSLVHADAFDALLVNGLGGADVIDASGLAAGLIQLTIDGGDGDDFIIGSAGADTIRGGRGADTALMGGGDDAFVWNPGDGSDTVEGQGGIDTLQFNGANVSEQIEISANGSRTRLTRDVGNIVMDLNSVERIDVLARGGADTITVDDLTGTGVQEVALDLGQDGQTDTVALNGTAGDDVITVTSENGVVTVTGLAATVTITGFDATDRLIINGLGGADVIDASRLATPIQLTEDGGQGDDVLIGSVFTDTLLGGPGDDILIGGGGLDILDGGPGNNVIIRGAAIAPAGVKI